MIIYSGTKSGFMSEWDDDELTDNLKKTIYTKMHRTTPYSEKRSWINSLSQMYQVLNDSDIPKDCGIAIEYNIPNTAKRVDFIISGYDQKHQPNVVIVELKQWESLKKVDSQDALVETYIGGAERIVVHPSYQAWSYKALIEDYNTTVQNTNIDLNPCAYLHNYERNAPDPVDDAIYETYLDEAPVFTKHQRKQLRNFIKKFIKIGDNQELIYEIDHGKIRPSKSLQNEIAKMIRGNQTFVMIDDQKVAYEQILTLSHSSKEDHLKRTIIVEGGPGTGKTVIAINLLAALTQKNQFVQYVSKNSAPRNVYAKMLTGTMTKTSVKNMFKGSGSYVNVPENTVDTILADEAHRLNERSGIFHNQGENQIKEIIHASRCSVFFIDESQRVTLSDIGSIAEIEKWSHQENSQVYYLKLISQFRCNGSNGYLSWLDHMLEIRDTANYDLNDIDYDFEVMDTPQEVYDKIKEKNKINNKSRVVAGYCWEWPKQKRDDTHYHDIQIGNFGISWNLNNSTTYAVDPESVHEAGCIHTVQGLEFDYVGVIIGRDMQYKDGHIITDFNQRAHSDQSLKGIKKLYKDDPEEAIRRADEIIKNTYRTLMTRGMKGCYIYCVDNALERYFKKSLEKKEY